MKVNIIMQHVSILNFDFKGNFAFKKKNQMGFFIKKV